MKLAAIDKGFTLLELIIVAIIIGILATLSSTQYSKIVEKGRSAEAKANLGMLRKLQTAYYLEYGVYAGIDNLGVGLPEGMCNSSYYFNYGCDIYGGCTANRCGITGKPPGTYKKYWINLTIDGVWDGTEGWY